MKTRTIQGMTLVLLMLMAAFAGCVADDTSDDTSTSTADTSTSTSDSTNSTADSSSSDSSSSDSSSSDSSSSDGSSSDGSSSDSSSSGGAAVSTMDSEDGGYTYASNVDNHRSLMADMCDIKTYASNAQWTAAKDVYQNGKNAPKSDGSYRTLAGFAAATGKQHNYDAYYGMNGSVDAHIMAALDGTGDFANTSDTVRYQGVAKLTANMAMVAYTIHELNTAVNKAEAGNWENNDSGAPHNWDEGWAFFHGPDENVGCGPVSTLNKRANDFGTKTNTSFGDVANTTHAITDAMVGGLAALQTNDSTGYNDAGGVVVKNVIIAYSQAVLKYTYKMDSTTDAAKYQAEGYAFWKTIEAYAADYTDACYNNKTHTMAYVGDAADSTVCDNFAWYTDFSMGGGPAFTGCYNVVSHTVATGVNESQCNDGFGAVGSTGMPMYYNNYGASQMNEVLDLTDATQLGTSYDVSAWLAPVWAHYGITSDDIGSYS